MGMKQIGIVAAIVVVAGLIYFGLPYGLHAPTPTPTPTPNPDGPKVIEAKAAVASLEDSRRADKIIDNGFAQQVPCGVVVHHARNPRTGEARVFVYMRKDGLIECYNGPGKHRMYEEVALKAISDLEVDIILANPTLYPPAGGIATQAVATPAPQANAQQAPIVIVVPQATATTAAPSAVPVLSDGRLCELDNSCQGGGR